ncbi:hypothetical protein QMK19_38940 [Streptomyces sp. H10-C2]|uniref:hypothetical protein n=1 Tax=unclassified Streptomyces TaxID=2593676 RepID=UPI0024B88617|nr:MULTISPECIES: hypothetical protein [unclassified Streptomyces]MDJ0347153.1 hypothetical protein [Streptomyces sp. PH10-H1]MDJ0375412.1 hypothetical protein [Streptomyces sp. H10-C2]
MSTDSGMELTGPDDEMELSGPKNGGWYTSQLADWVPLCPQLKDSAVRLYWIMRALVIEKHGPVRKLTVMELCHLLPTKNGGPSSHTRVRNLLRDLSAVGLISTPSGQAVSTSSRAKASGAALRIRVNDRPGASAAYKGPRNAFAALDSIRAAAREQAAAAARTETTRNAARKAEHAAQSTNPNAGQKSDPLFPDASAGQISDPLGQISDPLGQISDPHSGADLQDREPPFSPYVQSSRSRPDLRPSVRKPEVDAREGASTDGRTDDGGSNVQEAEQQQHVGGASPAAADAAPDNDNGAAVEAGTPGGPLPGAGAPPHRTASDGTEILHRMGRRVPQLALAGKVLNDQALRLDGLLAESERLGRPWSRGELLEALCAPFTEKIRTSAGAVVSARIGALPLTPNAPRIPVQGTAPDAAADGADWDRDGGRGGRMPSGRDLSSSAAWTWAEKRAALDAATRHGRDCAGDDNLCRRLAVEGETLCAEHLGWPVCSGGCGIRDRTGLCADCVAAGRHLLERGTPTADGMCPGYGDRECGQDVKSAGWCGRCRMEAQRAADRQLLADAATGTADAGWEQLTAAAAREAEHDAHNAAFTDPAHTGQAQEEPAPF